MSATAGTRSELELCVWSGPWSGGRHHAPRFRGLMDSDRLRSIELFSELSDDELERLAKVAHEASLDEGEALVRAGTWAYQMFAVEDGEVEVRRDGSAIATLRAGDVVGETGVVQRALRNADVVAASPVRVIFFIQADIGRMSKAMPDLERRLGDLLEKRKKD